MSKKWTLMLTVVLLVVLAVSGGYLLAKSLEYLESDRLNAEAASTAGLPPRIEAPPTLPAQPSPGQRADASEPDPADPEPDPYLTALREVDLAALQQVNGDVLGWITIPETDLSYPLLQGTDNAFYLNHAWTGKKNSSGSIFLDCKCARDMSSFNTIIYGHRMRNSTMFGVLREYAEQSFWEEHPCLYIADGSGVYRYDIFAVYEAGVQEIVYRLDVEMRGLEEELIRFALEHSVIQTGVVPEASDKLVTLSTCTGQGHETRWVLQAVRREGIDFPAEA